MKYRLVVLEKAVQDILLAAKWYEAKRPSLGHRLVFDFDAIREFPLRYAEDATNVRRAVLNKFPYNVYFRIEDDIVYVFACLHGRRSPRIWRSRSKSIT